MKTLSIVIPCYNERETIHEILRRVFAVSAPGWRIEIVVVDDCSTDGTRDILREYEKKARVIYCSQNGGKGTAVVRGLEAVTGDFILIQDADLEYDPKDIPTLLAVVTDSRSLIYGSRNIRSHLREGHIFSRLGVWFITKQINVLYGAELSDAWTCYKLFPAVLKPMFAAGRFESEIIFTLRALRAGYDVKEVPISYTPRDNASGKKIRYRDGFVTIAMIFKDWVSHLGKIRSRAYFITVFACAAILSAISVMTFKPTIIPVSDAPSYVQAMGVLTHSASQPMNFIPNRIITTVGALFTVISLSKIFDGYATGWLIMNVCFYLLSVMIFYSLVKHLHGSEKVAAISALFLAGNYAMLTFGLSYFMDIGGWMFYLAVALGMARYMRSGNHWHLWWAAVAVGVGGLFKEYALLGAFLIGAYLIYESWPSVAAFLKKVWRPALIAAVPTVILHAVVYMKYGYTYLDWLHSNQEHYVYASRLIEYIKTLGSLHNLLAFLVIGGIVYFIRDWKAIEDRVKAFTISMLISAAPILFWPAITQRITFITVPIAIVLASFLFKKFDRRWYLFLPILILYILASFYMDSFILNFVNLPF